MSDLIERLRESALDDVDCPTHCDNELEAADEIKRLQARVEALEHKEFHYLWMLEESGVDSSAAKASECMYGDECPYFAATEQECPECNGRGYTVFNAYGAGEPQATVEFNCDACSGTGVAATEQDNSYKWSAKDDLLSQHLKDIENDK